MQKASVISLNVCYNVICEQNAIKIDYEIFIIEKVISVTVLNTYKPYLFQSRFKTLLFEIGEQNCKMLQTADLQNKYILFLLKCKNAN